MLEIVLTNNFVEFFAGFDEILVVCFIGLVEVHYEFDYYKVFLTTILFDDAFVYLSQWREVLLSVINQIFEECVFLVPEKWVTFGDAFRNEHAKEPKVLTYT